jgi:hypothetical protein
VPVSQPTSTHLIQQLDQVGPGTPVGEEELK